MPSSTRKKKNQQNKILFIFLSTFFVSLITLIYIATAFTPKIDIDVNHSTSLEQNIPQDVDYVAEAEYKSIDSRLRDIQMDDKAIDTVTETTSDIIANLKKMKEEAIAKQIKNDEIDENLEVRNNKINNKNNLLEVQTKDEQPIKLDSPKLAVPKLATPQYPSKQEANQTQSTIKAQQYTKMTKVYVGKYADFNQAAIVQEALVKSSLVSSPFIKNLNGYYVIQVGSFSNQEAAQNVAELLISNGYAAKMILE